MWDWSTWMHRTGAGFLRISAVTSVIWVHQGNHLPQIKEEKSEELSVSPDVMSE